MDLSIIQWIDSHGLTCLVAYYVSSNAIAALDAPTANSSPFYRWFFKFANAMGANLFRAFSNSIESSPNWCDATQKIRIKQ